MRVLPFKIPKPELDALVFQVDYDMVFYDQLHQHEEIQLSLIVEGEGTLIVGDTINDYSKGDILVIGSNLPHVFKSDLKANVHSHMLTLFFTKNSFGKHFFELEELHELQPFFRRATNGFKVTSHRKRLHELFFQLQNATKLSRFIILLDLLKLASSASYKSLSSFIYDKKYTDIEGKRMREVFEFTMSHFNEDVSLESVSNVASMTKNAFCKYFKKRTNKTYFTFLNELRIENACKLLVSEKDLSIGDIAEQCGFNNISNFNRQFKYIKCLTPNQFRKLKS
ncbi:AraC family transcriptional regulator [Geojedonia litorea]|uniref:AraC family transcriptional regulator n=1 Tax=Geojedonia litorea TaxID=1268269 RepID=A0ABV9N5Z0_9FLAO